MVVNMLAFFVKIAGNGNVLPVYHQKPHRFQCFHIIQIYDIALVAPQKAGLRL